MRQPFRFGIVRNQSLPWPRLVEHFQRYEALGFDSAWGCDHLQRPSEPEGPYFEGWTTIAALATLTSRIRLGLLVSCNTFRHPALLAKQAVTVDHISGGRLELGLGAGWFEPEAITFGLPYPETAERVRRVAEAVPLIDQLMRQDVTTFEGDYYQLREAPFRPAPVQRPRPPLTLGAHGPKMLGIVARYADRWNSFGSVEEIRERNAILDEHCARIGRDPASIIRSVFGMAPRGTMSGRLKTDPWQSVGAFWDFVEGYRAVGIDEFLVDGPNDDQFSVMERVAGEVLPKLRAERPAEAAGASIL